MINAFLLLTIQNLGDPFIHAFLHMRHTGKGETTLHCNYRPSTSMTEGTHLDYVTRQEETKKKIDSFFYCLLWASPAFLRRLGDLEILYTHTHTHTHIVYTLYPITVQRLGIITLPFQKAIKWKWFKSTYHISLVKGSVWLLGWRIWHPYFCFLMIYHGFLLLLSIPQDCFICPMRLRSSCMSVRLSVPFHDNSRMSRRRMMKLCTYALEFKSDMELGCVQHLWHGQTGDFT